MVITIGFRVVNRISPDLRHRLVQCRDETKCGGQLEKDSTELSPVPSSQSTAT